MRFRANHFAVILCILWSAGNGIAGTGQSDGIIPLPLHAEWHPGIFILNPKTSIFLPNRDGEFSGAAKYLTGRIGRAAGFSPAIRSAGKIPSNNCIAFIHSPTDSLGAEGYRLYVTANGVRIESGSDAGAFYAVQTLFQLLPPEIYRDKPAHDVRWSIPAVSIIDRPRFSWRGMHLDVSRHFFPKDFIKTYIDMIAMHKMNVFHWHLTDDQGWRIEIKKYPRLTEIGAWRVNRENRNWNDRAPQRKGEQPSYGGYYTQDAIREIVRYAAERHVTIVPEIEMPAHAVAALAAYPQYSCSGGPFTAPTGGVWPDSTIFCAGNDSTFLFLQEILREVMDLFPGPFIHIGGDEADKTQWKKCPRCRARMKQEGLKDEAELQSYFTKRIEKFLSSQGRRLIGWDEILEGGLPPEATVMSWRGSGGGLIAAREGHDVVMTPGEYCYFDHYQGAEQYEPPAIGGYTPLSKVYRYEPVPDSLTPVQAKHILGAQANVWSEYIPAPEHAEYMTMPRMAAMAEVLWSPGGSRNWDDFVPRVEQQMKRYESAGYRYAKSAYLVRIVPSADSIKNVMIVSLSTEMTGTEIRYTLDGAEPSAASPIYDRPFAVDKTSLVKACAFRGNEALGAITARQIVLHKAYGKHIALKHPFDGQYPGGGMSGLTDGMRGSASFNDGNWQGYHQNDLEAVVDLGESMPINRISTGFLQNTYAWIFFPSSVAYSVSDDGLTFTPAGNFEIPVAPAHQDASIREVTKELSGIRARYVKVAAKNVGTCPAWHIGRGDLAWLFVDEIVVQ